MHALHQRQGLLVKDAFDATEAIVKQCRVATYRSDKNPTLVNQKRLEVLSVRSVRVVLGSIEKVSEVCQLLKNHYTKIHMDNTAQAGDEESPEKERGGGGGGSGGGSGSGGGGSELSPSGPGRRLPRALSAPAWRSTAISDLVNAEGGSRQRRRRAGSARPQSAVSSSKRPKNKGGGGGAAPYRKFPSRTAERKDNKGGDRRPASAPTGAPTAKAGAGAGAGAEDGDGGIYCDDGGDFEDREEDDLFEESGAGAAVEERGRGRHRVKKMEKKKSKGPKHTCAYCTEKFSGDCKFLSLLLLLLYCIVFHSSHLIYLFCVQLKGYRLATA
jgi:hypothetical protein